MAYVDSVSALAPPVICREMWDDLWPACKPLMLAHKVETGQDDPRQGLFPDHQAIRRTEAAGGLLLLSARTSACLVGYSIWYLSPSLETSGLLVAQQAPWYVIPEWRSRGLGLALWREAKRQLRRRGVRLLFAHFPACGPGSDLGPFFAREGARVVGTEVSIWLEEAA